MLLLISFQLVSDTFVTISVKSIAVLSVIAIVVVRVVEVWSEGTEVLRGRGLEREVLKPTRAWSAIVAVDHVQV